MWRPAEDGGAFAECFFAQYPLGMGRRSLPPSLTDALSKRQGRHAEKTPPSAEEAPRGPVPSSSFSFSPSLPSPDAGALVVSASRATHGANAVALSGKGANDAEALAQTTEKTKEALEQVLRDRQAEAEDFSGRNIRRTERKKPTMEIALPGDVGVAGMYDPAPIVRSPVRAKKSAGGSNEEGSSSFSSGGASVPFSIGNWKNKRKLIIPLEQRLAQQDDTLLGDSGGIGDHVMQLAMAMQKARREVEEEQAAREKARQEEEERQQAEREAEATQRARELLEKAAADMMQTSTQRKKETREERLERIRLERELREREKQQEVRQRRLTKAAARLGITVEALEADEELLRTIDEAAAHGVAAVDNTVSHGSYPVTTTATTMLSSGAKQERSTMDQHLPSLHVDDDEDGTRPAGGIRKGVFGSAVISNEGVRREMEVLAKMEAEQARVNDGIVLGRDDDDDDDGSSDDNNDGLGISQFMKKKRRL